MGTVQIVATILLSSGVSHVATLPEPTFATIVECEEYLRSDEFRVDLYNLQQKLKQGFTFDARCVERSDGA